MGTDERTRKSDLDGIIDHIYEVAVDPNRYESLIDLWEAKLAPLRQDQAGAMQSSAAATAAESLSAHARRADTVLDRINVSRPQTVMNSILEGIEPSAAFIVDEALMIQAANPAARSIFGAQPASPASETGLPERVRALLMRELKSAFSADPSPTNLIRFNRDDAQRMVVLRVRPIELGIGSNRHALVVSNELAWPEGLEEIMQEAFGLTEAEASIVRLLTQGQSAGEIARTRKRSAQTVKTQLRAILAKTSTRSQVELVRTTLGFMDVVGATSAETAGKSASASTSPGRIIPLPFTTLLRPGGRRADHLVIGDPDGAPMLYFSMDFGFIRWPEHAEHHLRDNGLKLLAVVRPGFGNSDPVGSRKDLLSAILDDAIAILDHHKAGKAPVICLGGDAFFAYHLADRYPDRISAILNAAAGFPVQSSAQYERMEKWHRFILANARYAPAMLPFLVKAGFSLAKRIGKIEFMQAIYRRSPADLDTIRDPAILDAVLEGSRIALDETVSAHAAFAAETILKQQDWSKLVDECPVPVHVWYSILDPQTPGATMSEMIARFPGPSYHPVEDGGQLMIFRIWKQVLETASPFLEKTANTSEAGPKTRRKRFG